MRSALAWDGIVRETERLNLTQSDSALAKAKLAEANETVKTRLKEAWCYLLYPRQDGAEADVAWISGKVPARDGLLGQASKRLVDEEGLLPELGPARLDRELQRISEGQGPSLSEGSPGVSRPLSYLPRLKDRSVLVRTAPGHRRHAAGTVCLCRKLGTAGTYRGLAIDNAANVHLFIDNESLIGDRRRGAPPAAAGPYSTQAAVRPLRIVPIPETDAGMVHDRQPTEKKPTRFIGTVMISSERLARDIHRIVEAVVEQLTALPGSEVTLKLEIDAEVPSGLDRAKVRTLIENANTGLHRKSMCKRSPSAPCPPGGVVMPEPAARWVSVSRLRGLRRPQSRPTRRCDRRQAAQRVADRIDELMNASVPSESASA